MKNLIFRYLLLVVAILAVVKLNSQGIRIESGTYWVTEGSAQLVIENGGLRNEGTFLPGTGVVSFSGTCASSGSFISGTSGTGFYVLRMQKSTNGMRLQRAVSVANSLSLISGDSLELNGYTIDLGFTGSVNGESNTRRITGANGGYIQASNVLSAPLAVNPGNLGFSITSASNPGTVVVRRGHQQQSGASIRRYFDITATNNSGLNADVQFYYFDSELGGVAEPNLGMFSSSNAGVNWSNLGEDGLDQGNNFLTVNGVDSFNRFTLANISAPLAVHLIRLYAKKEGQIIRLYWSTSSEDENSHFELERSADGIHFSVLGVVNGAGTTDQLHSYTFDDINPLLSKNIYRLRQVDKDGRFTYSYTIFVENKSNYPSVYNLFPNPVGSEVLYLNLYSYTTGTFTLQLFNANGKKVKEQELHYVSGSQALAVSVSGLPPGIYFIKSRNEGIKGLCFIRQ